MAAPDLGRRRVDKAAIGQALGAQEFLCDILRGIADALILCDPHRGRFERSLTTKRSRHWREAGPTSQREGSQKLAFRLAHGHRSRLQFAFDLVQEAPVCPVGNDLLRA